jgi:hypothetical protein
MKAPAFQFYPADWQRDLSEHPLEIEGAWIRICCSLWWSDTPGKSAKPLTNWARVMRVGEKKSLSIITYLLNQNIAEVDIQNTTITISSRRMIKDEYIRNIRRNAGNMGGNPSLKKQDETPILDKQNLVNQKPTPSSSSSSSKIKTIKLKISFEEGKFKNIPPSIIEKWRQVAPGINVPAEIAKAELWVISNPDKVRSRWESFLSRWIVKAQDNFARYGGNGNGNGSKDFGRAGTTYAFKGRGKDESTGGLGLPKEHKPEAPPIISEEERQRNLSRLRQLTQ